MRQKCVNYDQIWQNLSTKANHSISPKVTKSVNMVISSKFKCSSFPHFPRHFFHKKCLEKKCSLHPHYPRHLFKKNSGKKIIYIRTFSGTFKISIKSAWQKVSFTSALPQALNISSAVSSTVTVTSLEKKCPGKKSAWDAASQHPAYYAGLLVISF